MGHTEYKVVIDNWTLFSKPQLVKVQKIETFIALELGQKAEVDIPSAPLPYNEANVPHFCSSFPSNYHLQLAFDRSWNDYSLANDSLLPPPLNTIEPHTILLVFFLHLINLAPFRYPPSCILASHDPL